MHFVVRRHFVCLCRETVETPRAVSFRLQEVWEIGVDPAFDRNDFTDGLRSLQFLAAVAVSVCTPMGSIAVREDTAGNLRRRRHVPLKAVGST